MYEPVETIEYRGHDIKIYSDMDPLNPRVDYDNVGTMVCWHSRYNLGDEHDFSDPGTFWEELVRQECPELDERIEAARERTPWIAAQEEKCEAMIQRWIEDWIERNLLVLPLYLYDHSGITMNTGGFSCPWDSGQVGYIYVTKKRALEEWGGKRLTKERREKFLNYLRGEVETYDHYLTGSVYGYMIEANSDGVEAGYDCDDSCWGFFGYGRDTDWDYMISEAKDAIDCEIRHVKRQRFETLKTLIKNKVPLAQRPERLGDVPLLTNI